MRIDNEFAPQSPVAEPAHVRWLHAFLVLLLLLFSAWVRLDTAAADGALDRGPERGLLKSDPGLLYYLTSQVAHAEGWLPEDWSADPRIAASDTIRVAADYTVGQEYLLGWSWRMWGAGVSLLMWCHYGSALMAALAVLGVWGLAYELCGGRWLALAACVLYLSLPASFRTVGFVLIREDLSLSLFAIHLWLAARAARVGTRTSVAWAAAFAVLALATWHAMSFVILMEVAAIVGLFFITGINVVAVHGIVLFIVLLAGALVVPSLGGGAFWATLFTLAILQAGPTLRPQSPRLVVAGLLLLVAAMAIGLLESGSASFGHVYEVVAAKLRLAGQLPSDPSMLSFDARLLWQGPFATLDLAQAPSLLGIALWLGVPACLYGLFANSSVAKAQSLFALASLPATWLVVRMACLSAILLPPLTVFLFVRLQASAQSKLPKSRSTAGTRSFAELATRIVPFVGCLCLLSQCAYFIEVRPSHRLTWYRPQSRVQTLAQLVDAVERHVPEGQSVASDFMSSTAILAHTGRPMILQPKWERAPARRRVESFWQAFYHGTPEELRDHLIGAYGCRYLVVDRTTLWTKRASRYLAGMPSDQTTPQPGSAAEHLLGSQSTQVSGYRRLWSSGDSVDPTRPPDVQLFVLD